jgi:hypothetical protein
MSIVQSPKKEFDLDFSISEIKKNIDKIIATGKGSYTLKSKNDLINTYTILIAAGLSITNMEITLNKVDEKKTHCSFQIITPATTKFEAERFGKYTDQFLNILSKGLQGEEITTQLVKGTKSGCFGIAILLVGMSIFITYFFVK